MSEGSETNNNVDAFKMAVHEWLRIEEDLAVAQKVLREKRKRKEQLNDFIANYLKSQNKEICNIGDNNAIVLTSRKSTCALKKNYIVSVLNDVLRNEEQSTELMNRMYAMREVREKYVIKKTEL